MIDVNKYTKVGEYRNGALHWFEDRDINAVYIISIGKDSYIGSTKYVYARVQEHLNLLRTSRHTHKMQEAFNKSNMQFDVYVIERGIDDSELTTKENRYIAKLKPNLNKIGVSQNPILRIKEAIKEHNLEVREVARRLGITPTALSQHINGKMYKGKRVDPNPSMDVLQRIANAIGCDVVELFDPVEQNNKPFITCPHCGKPINLKVE